MPNHFHLIARDVNGNLPKCMAHFMRESSKEIAFAAGRINRCWGTRFHSSVITSPIHYLHAYKYVYRNPVAGGLVSSPFDYRFSTLPYLVGRQRELIPMFEDFTLFNHLESSIGWLEAAYDEEDAKRIKKAVRRKKFGYAIDRRTHAEISLRDTPPK
jgi:putative transposase